MPGPHDQPEETSSGVTRRQFLELSAATALAVGTGGFSWAAEVKQGIPYRTLGKTGEKVSLVGVGGASAASFVGRLTRDG